MSLHAVVAVKGTANGKDRLRSALSAEERQRLILTMLHDVLGALSSTRGIQNISVLTRDHSFVPSGFGHIDDVGCGLNFAVGHAAAVLARAGVRSMLVLPADLPFATAADIEMLLQAGKQHPAVIAPDARGSGTNALLLSPPELVQPRFGPNSYSIHQAAIPMAGASLATVARPGLAHDVDLPEDLETLAGKAGGRYAFLVAALKKAS